MDDENKEKKKESPEHPDTGREDLDQFTVLQGAEDTHKRELSANEIDADGVTGGVGNISGEVIQNQSSEIAVSEGANSESGDENLSDEEIEIDDQDGDDSGDDSGSFSGQNATLLGMTVEVNIITGRKTIIAYLLKPIHLSLQTAFSER